VQRISVSVPSTITPPTLTNPSVSYSVVNNGSGGYTFSGAAKGDNPNLGPFYRGGTYTVNINATGHPFYFTTDNGANFSAGTYFGEYTSGVTGSRNETGSITFTVPAGAPDTLYYQCGNHSVMRGEISIKDLAVETNINGNYVVYFQHTQEGHKTPVELRPIPSLVNQMCLVYDSSTNRFVPQDLATYVENTPSFENKIREVAGTAEGHKTPVELRPIPSLVNQMCLVYDSSTNRFVPQDLATYVENTPSFENKIREVAGTAELVVEDGSAVVAKVNVYDDSTYLPLAGNNAGDQAFATDTNILYIWDGTAWQQAGTTNSDDLTEGSTNIFFTDERVDDRLSNLLVGGNNITATYDDTAGTLTLDGQPGYTDTDVATYLGANDYDTATNIVATITDSAPGTLDTLNVFTDERVDDRLSNLLVGGNNITATYDDTAGTLTLDGQPGYTDTDVATYLGANDYDTATNIVATITDSAPGTLDTLNELAAALGDDPNFATTTANNIATKLPLAGGTMTGDLTVPNIITSGNVDGRDVSVDGAKLDLIEANATADQTASEIKTAYESNSDTNEFSDAEQTKLANIEANATADQTKADIDALNIDAATVDGLDSTQFLRSDQDDTTSGNLTVQKNIKSNGGFIINSSTISDSYTIANGENAMSTGPIVLGANVVITLDPGSRWVVV